MLYTREWVYEKYNECNEKYFGGKLPPISYAEIKLTKNKNPWGRGGCRSFRKDWATGEYKAYGVHLELSNYYDTDERDKLEVLVHEMCHIYEYFVEPKYYIECVIRRRWSYDHPKHGHGTVFYQQAQRLEKYGFHVQRFVDDETHKNAEVSDDIARKHQGRLNAGVHVLKFKCRKSHKGYDYGYVVCSSTNYREWVEHSKTTSYFTEVHDCFTHDKAILAYPTSRSVGTFRLSNGPFDKVLGNVAFDEETVIRDDYGTAEEPKVAPKPQAQVKEPELPFPEPEPTRVNAPQPVPEPPKDRRYTFSIKTVDKWGRESVFQVKDATEEEAKAQMRQRFPKWSDEIINEKFKKFTGMRESVELTREDIQEMVSRVVDRVRGAQSEDDELRAAIASMPDVIPGHIDDN